MNDYLIPTIAECSPLKGIRRNRFTTKFISPPGGERKGQNVKNYEHEHYLIKNATIVNEGKTFKGDLLIKDELISAIGLAETLKSHQGQK